MIINTKVTIFKPRKEVWDYLTNPDYLPKWIGGLEDYQHITGEYGKEGAQGLLKFRENGKLIEMREEVIASKKPEEYSGKYSHKDFDMIINNTLIDETDHTTLICSTEYRFKSFKWKILSRLIKGRLQKRQNEDLQRLKQAVELTDTDNQ